MSAVDGQGAGDGAGSAGRAEPPPELSRASQELIRADLNPTPLNDFDADHRQRLHEATVKQREIDAGQADDDRRLRRSIAGRVFWAITAQVAIADVTFLVYGFSNDWEIPGGTINAWLAATVVQVIAVGLVITRSLFPSSARMLSHRTS